VTEKQILAYLNSCLLFFLFANELKKSPLYPHLVDIGKITETDNLNDTVERSQAW
jgi:hypothetical protein